MTFALLLLALSAHAQTYDVVIAGGRVLDPETGVDAIRHLGLRNGKIVAMSASPLEGKRVLDAQGLIVAPGFIDLHSHGQDAENYRAKAMDGVTSALECEVGAADIDAWYATRSGKALIHHGVTVGHLPVRMRQMNDSGRFLPASTAVTNRATDEQITEMARQIERGLQQGAVGVGFGMAYTPAAAAVEYIELFRTAARFGVAAYAHVASGVEGLNAAIGYAASTGAALHVVHLNSSGARRNTQHFLRIIEEARRHGMDITTECYPYTAGQTAIDSAIFADGWQQRLGISYPDLQWTATGERLTVESFARYRKTGGSVITFTNSEEMVERAVVSPLTMIASDGILRSGIGHPRSTGAYSRILAEYVRKRRVLPLMDAIRKMSLMPAQRLEKRVPAMRNKGRIRVGADADLVVFDAQRVTDRSDYSKPAVHSEGFRYVLVNGTLVVDEGKLNEAALPGQAIRALARN